VALLRPYLDTATSRQSPPYRTGAALSSGLRYATLDPDGAFIYPPVGQESLTELVILSNPCVAKFGTLSVKLLDRPV
jgi:hypothetical protein